MLNNLYVRVLPDVAFKVLAIVEDVETANRVCNFNGGGVMDTIDGTAIITSCDQTKLSDHMWEADKSLPALQIGHEFVRITQ